MRTVKDGTHGTYGNGRNYNGTFTELFENFFSYQKKHIRGSVVRIQQGVLKRVQEFRGTSNIKPIYIIFIRTLREYLRKKNPLSHGHDRNGKK